MCLAAWFWRAITNDALIAARIGGSKTTLWTYFPSKEALFAAVVNDIVEHYGAALSIELPDDQPVESVLRKFGAALLSTVLSELIIALHRLVLGEASRFPQLAEIFYARGARRGQERVAAYLERAMVRGALRAGDAHLASRQFAGFCLSGSFQMALLGLELRPSATAIARDLHEAVEMVLHCWQITKDH